MRRKPRIYRPLLVHKFSELIIGWYQVAALFERAGPNRDLMTYDRHRLGTLVTLSGAAYEKTASSTLSLDLQRRQKK